MRIPLGDREQHRHRFVRRQFEDKQQCQHAFAGSRSAQNHQLSGADPAEYVDHLPQVAAQPNRTTNRVRVEYLPQFRRDRPAGARPPESDGFGAA